MIHEVIPVGWLQCNCSILGDETTGEAVVIDPGDETERVLEILARHKLRVKGIIITHTHFDHIGGLDKLKRATGAAAMMHEADFPMYRDLGGLATLMGIPAPPVVDVDRFLKEGDTVRWGSMALDVLYTPGHSPGSLSLHLPGENARILSGDTLFNGSIGRTDLWKGSLDEILKSIHDKLLPFDDETLVYPGHGPSTTIGEERARNPFLQKL
jgi:hydroxyacylglutathione hydrolase